MSGAPIIICVDDDGEVVRGVARCLMSEPFEIRTTTHASEALAWIARDDIAVVISDYDMPEMTGAQLASHARRLRPETVRILLTGQHTVETAVDGIHQGEVFRFLGKPYDRGKVRQAVRDAVTRHHELRALAGDVERRSRRALLHAGLEREFAGITTVARRGEAHVVEADPWPGLDALGLAGLVAAQLPRRRRPS